MIMIGKIVGTFVVSLMFNGSGDIHPTEPVIIAETLDSEGIVSELNKQEISNYLGNIELEDYNPDLPTQRREGVYTSGRVDKGVWYWEFESKHDMNQQKPYNGVSYY